MPHPAAVSQPPWLRGRDGLASRVDDVVWIAPEARNPVIMMKKLRNQDLLEPSTTIVMCEWYRRNYACGHHFTGAAEWCYRYSQTQKRCKVVVTQVDWDSSVCKNCLKKGSKTEVPWEHLIDRTKFDPTRDE
ncbi:hypothetical protein CTRI78_v008916 [Colletotrichum trifolii]|uniref:Uncharacterized protein n=2 Tax=Colletotrichum orbiculare species complex TaxID=2707354 RepID=A0A4R8R1Z0_COLTR|nr:hypothetical protein CTRI78_v008916 [Colletotrichum trifolii]